MGDLTGCKTSEKEEMFVDVSASGLLKRCSQLAKTYAYDFLQATLNLNAMHNAFSIDPHFWMLGPQEMASSSGLQVFCAGRVCDCICLRDAARDSGLDAELESLHEYFLRFAALFDSDVRSDPDVSETVMNSYTKLYGDASREGCLPWLPPFSAHLNPQDEMEFHYTLGTSHDPDADEVMCDLVSSDLLSRFEDGFSVQSGDTLGDLGVQSHGDGGEHEPKPLASADRPWTPMSHLDDQFRDIDLPVDLLDDHCMGEAPIPAPLPHTLLPMPRGGGVMGTGKGKRIPEREDEVEGGDSMVDASVSGESFGDGGPDFFGRELEVTEVGAYLNHENERWENGDGTELTRKLREKKISKTTVLFMVLCKTNLTNRSALDEAGGVHYFVRYLMGIVLRDAVLTDIIYRDSNEKVRVAIEKYVKDEEAMEDIKKDCPVFCLFDRNVQSLLPGYTRYRTVQNAERVYNSMIRLYKEHFEHIKTGDCSPIGSAVFNKGHRSVFV